MLQTETDCFANTNVGQGQLVQNQVTWIKILELEISVSVNFIVYVE